MHTTLSPNDIESQTLCGNEKLYNYKNGKITLTYYFQLLQRTLIFIIKFKSNINYDQNSKNWIELKSRLQRMYIKMTSKVHGACAIYLHWLAKHELI